MFVFRAARMGAQYKSFSSRYGGTRNETGSRLYSFVISRRRGFLAREVSKDVSSVTRSLGRKERHERQTKVAIVFDAFEVILIFGSPSQAC